MDNYVHKIPCKGYYFINYQLNLFLLLINVFKLNLGILWPE